MSYLFRVTSLSLLATLSLPTHMAFPAFAGELGPADLSPQQMSQAFPREGLKWKAFCGTHDNGKECEIELGPSELIIDGTYRISYSQIKSTESKDAHMAITRLAKVDPVYTGWPRYRNVNNVKYFKNTVLVAYKDKSSAISVALFAFSENSVSDWYGLSNAMRMIALGAKPLPQEPK